MFNLDKFIGEHVTHRAESMFAADISANSATLSAEIKDKKVCVIGGAGSIGSSFIKAVLRFEPKSMVVVDLNENGLAELVRDVRSTDGLLSPMEFRCYTLTFADPISGTHLSRRKRIRHRGKFLSPQTCALGERPLQRAGTY